MAKIGKAAPKPKAGTDSLENWDGSKVPEINLVEVAETGYKLYGQYVIEGRALPLAIDGLKPVQRRILQSMLELGLNDGSRKVKAAKVVGDTMGNYHPHGDSSIYGAMQTMAGMKHEKGELKGQWLVTNQNEPLILGLGNWGDHTDKAAAPRYTECRLTEYAANVMLDPEYMDCVPMRRNYDDTRWEPLLLPAKLPNLMINGTNGIAVGVKSEFPGFHVDGVIECALQALRSNLTAKMCYDNLIAKFPYGGGTLDDDSWKDLLKAGNSGTVYAYPESHYDGKVLVVTSILPTMGLNAIRNKLMRNKLTKAVNDETDKTGIRIVAIPEGMTQSERDAWAEDLQWKLYATMSARINILDFKDDGEQVADLVQSNIPDIFYTWANWRYHLERQVIQRRIERTGVAQHRDELLLLVCNNLDVLKKSMEIDDPVKYVSDKLNVDTDDSKWIRQQAVQRFDKLSADELKKKIAAAKASIVQLKKDYEDPIPGIESQITNLQLA